MPRPVVGERPPTTLEVAVGDQRTPIIVLLILLPLVCWAWVVIMARDMYGPMTGASAWMMTLQWDARHLLLLWAMWAVMMTGMMVPSAAPLLLMYGIAARRQSPGRAAARQIYALAAGYVAVWGLFSVGATVAQRILSARLIVSPMMTLTSPRAGASLLVLAGLYQLTPLKRVCLQKCQSPLGYLMHHWRAGTGGAFRMGLNHGGYCLGCCWALTAFVAFEKLVPFFPHRTLVSGGLLIAAGIWIFVRV